MVIFTQMKKHPFSGWLILWRQKSEYSPTNFETVPDYRQYSNVAHTIAKFIQGHPLQEQRHLTNEKRYFNQITILISDKGLWQTFLTCRGNFFSKDTRRDFRSRRQVEGSNARQVKCWKTTWPAQEISGSRSPSVRKKNKSESTVIFWSTKIPTVTSPIFTACDIRLSRIYFWTESIRKQRKRSPVIRTFRSPWTFIPISTPRRRSMRSTHCPVRE